MTKEKTKQKEVQAKKTLNTEYNFEQIEVNVLTRNNIIHTQIVDIKETTFEYDGFEYDIDSDKIYLYPTTKGYMQTLFYNKKVIKSEIGKLVIFPSYFTHTHRGQKCPDKKNRYIITGYVNFLDLT